MPSKRRNDDDDEKRPAYGLSEDVYDERLLRLGPVTDEEREEYWLEERLPHELRKPERYPADPAAWLAQRCMTQTETALRLARALIVSGVAHASVRVTFAGNELTRRDRPQFPVERFLVERLGFLRQRLKKDSWQGFYRIEGREHRLVLMDHDRMEGHLETKLQDGRRLVAFVSRGHTASTRSSGEIKWVRSVIGRAATWNAKPSDVLAVAVPRSAHFSKIVRAFRRTEGIGRLRLHLLTVDRQTNDVAGLIDLRSAI